MNANLVPAGSAQPIPLLLDIDQWMIFGGEVDTPFITTSESEAHHEYRSLFYGPKAETRAFGKRIETRIRVMRFNLADGTCREVTEDFADWTEDE